MKVGVIGLGKLGLPMAETIESLGHQVLGHDPWQPIGIARGEPGVIARECDPIFVVVPTPHEAQYEGITPLPDTRADFDYRPLLDALTTLRAHEAQGTVAVVSTVLPGTWRRAFQKCGLRYVYNPSFCAMGSVAADFLSPEFVLLGHEGDPGCLPEFYADFQALVLETDITTTEGIKVIYNTFVTAKVTLANYYGELAERVGMDGGAIHQALMLANRRIGSGKYLAPGMGDGGPCHPRDNIALSWLAREVGMSSDLFSKLMEAREAHTRWLASMVPPGAVLFGVGFKPESTIGTGSPALLLSALLDEMGVPHTIAEDPEPGAFNVIATAHDRYRKIRWPEGSTVLDPHGIICDQPGVIVRRIGRR